MRGFLVLIAISIFCAEIQAKKVAITIDDFTMKDGPRLNLEQRDQAMLDALKKHGVQAAAFIKGSNLEKKRIRNRVKRWDDQGHLIANHTYRHPNYHKVSFSAFSQEILDCDRLIQDFKNYTRLFRFPMLKAGNTAPKRDKIRQFLKQHRYKNGYVTIDASDWYIETRMVKRLKVNPNTDLIPYRDFYLDHIWKRTQYYDALATKYLKRDIHNTLLIHHYLLNALFLDELIKMYEKKGWEVIDAEEAFKDPIFNEQPNVLPAGESIVWSIAKEAGDETLRYPAEDGSYEKAAMDKLGL